MSIFYSARLKSLTTSLDRFLHLLEEKCDPIRNMMKCFRDCSKMAKAALSERNCGSLEGIKPTRRLELGQFVSRGIEA